MPCEEAEISEVFAEKQGVKKYPLLISGESNEIFGLVPSILHGRSVVLDYDETTEKYIVTKGNGLTYFPYGYINTEELTDNIWGICTESQAERDYFGGEFVSRLGIITNEMQAYFSLENQKVRTEKAVEAEKPVILQYAVKCPYRIADLPFLTKKTVEYFTGNWNELHNSAYNQKHCIAADVLMQNLSKLHMNGVLHNAIHSQNYTAMLELLDFELARTPETPYDTKDDEESFGILQRREAVQSLEIVGFIADFFGEEINKNAMSEILIKHGFSWMLPIK